MTFSSPKILNNDVDTKLAESLLSHRHQTSLEMNQMIQNISPHNVPNSPSQSTVTTASYTISPRQSISNVPSGVSFLDEVAALQEEARRLKQQGVNIIIATGHSGYPRERRMAELIEDIDVIVGGHSHSLLYTGETSAANRSSCC